MASLSPEQLAELDKLNDEEKYDEIYNKLKRSDGNYKDMGYEELWRLGRVLRFLILTEGQNDKNRRLAWIKEGLDAMKIAAEKFPNECLSNTWYGILLSLDGEEHDTKTKIKQAYIIKEYFDKGYAADPKDFVTLQSLGTWCFEVASLGSIERKIASFLFATPPVSTFEDALKYFLEANEVKPSYPLTVCRIAQCYWKLGNKDEAKKFAEEALKLKATDGDIIKAQKECRHYVK
uniref:Regulator of microtubule dynamics protein 1 n=1 Tax=Mesocestoides corti TaxID=53468 RepID=A0A5K3EPY2_MESCO